MPYLRSDVAIREEQLRRFGAELRRCRLHGGMSQTVLAERSGVPQSTISRLERGLVPRSAMFKIVLMADALGRHLPLAYCPHDHRCAWSRLGADGNRAESLVELELEAMGLGSRFDGL